MHLTPEDLERRSRWRKQQLWLGRLIKIHGLEGARKIINKSERMKDETPLQRYNR